MNVWLFPVSKICKGKKRIIGALIGFDIMRHLYLVHLDRGHETVCIYTQMCFSSVKQVVLVNE